MRKRTGWIRVATLVAMVMCLSGGAYAGAISIGSTSFSNTIDTAFDVSATAVPWIDGTTINGVFAKSYLTTYHNLGVPTNLAVSAGASTSANLYSFGSAGSTDRAIGWQSGSTVGQSALGIQYKNTTGADMTKDVKYIFKMEQWRAPNVTPQDYKLQYKVTSTGGNILTDTSWTDLQIFYQPNLTTAGAIDGNLTANQTNLVGQIANLTLPMDQYLTFRIYEVDHAGNDAGMGLDSVSVWIPVPEPVTMGMFGFGALALWLLRRMRK